MEQKQLKTMREKITESLIIWGIIPDTLLDGLLPVF